MKPPRILYIFNWGRKARLNDDAFPTEMFYGAPQLQKMGYPVEIFEEADFGIRRHSPLWTRPIARATGVDINRVGSLLRNVRTLNSFDAIVTNANNFALELGTLTNIGALHTRVFAIVMGLLPTGKAVRLQMVTEWCTRRLSLLAISRNERQLLQTRLSGRIQYLPFGVDATFWTPNPSEQRVDKPYVFTIGNDANRDFELLISCWKQDWPLLRIVTRRSLSNLPPNVEVIAGDWRDNVLSDSHIRELYRKSLFVVVPSKETFQPSGQSVSLQAMACGKAVILSRIGGLWEPDLMLHASTCLLVPPGDKSNLSRAIESLLQSPAQRLEIGNAGRMLVEQHLNTTNMARALASEIEQLAPPN